MKITSTLCPLVGIALIGIDLTDAGEKHASAPALRAHKDFESKHLKNKRTVTVYLPPGYFSDKDQRYPVFYFHDGQNRMTADDKATALIRAGKMRPAIFVFIDSKDQENRYREMTHHRWPGKKFLGGDGALYG